MTKPSFAEFLHYGEWAVKEILCTRKPVYLGGDIISTLLRKGAVTSTRSNMKLDTYCATLRRTGWNPTVLLLSERR